MSLYMMVEIKDQQESN